MGAPRIGVLALQGDVREHVAALTAAGADPTLVRRPADVDNIDAIVVPGGESTTIGKLLVIFELLEPLQKRIRDGMPAFGSCAGMILLADRVLDGTSDQAGIGGIDMTVRRNAFGRQVDSWEEDLEIDGIVGEPLHAVFIRAPWVEDCGSDVRVLARVGSRASLTTPRPAARRPDRPLAAFSTSEMALPFRTSAALPAAAGAPLATDRDWETRPRIVAVRQGPLLATAFHPELTGDRRMHDLFVSIVEERPR